jgi:hypothetical protein
MEMNIFGFPVRLNPPGAHNIWALFLIIFSIVTFVQGIGETHWPASYIIPRGDELVRTGPYSISEFKVRSAIFIGFSRDGGAIEYKENIYDFDIPPDRVLALVNQSRGHPSAYLMTDKNNSSPRGLWGVYIGGLQILSYEKAIGNYEADRSFGYSWFWASAFFVAWFLFSILDVRRLDVKNKSERI